MKDELLCGLTIGFIVGALLVYSNKNVKKMMDQGKEFVKEKIEEVK